MDTQLWITKFLKKLTTRLRRNSIWVWHDGSWKEVETHLPVLVLLKDLRKKGIQATNFKPSDKRSNDDAA
jgi:hypothetical protein